MARDEKSERNAQVIAALLAGQGVNEIARAYKLKPYQVSRIKKKLETDGELQQIATKTRANLEDLIEEYLRENLITLAVQAKHFRDPDWLKRQSAEQLAVLHGVSTDKAIRLLEAAELSGDDRSGGPGTDVQPLPPADGA